LLETGLQKTFKAFQKETGAEMNGDEVAVPKAKRQLAKQLAPLELTAACQLWLDTQLRSTHAEDAAPTAPADEDADPPKRKKKKALVEAEAVEAADAAAQDDAAAPEEAAPETEALAEEPRKKKRKRTTSREAVLETKEAGAEVETQAPEADAQVVHAPQKKKAKKEKEEKRPGVPFKRVDDSKWTDTVKDSRLLDNTHKAKVKFGTSAGDSWADRAAEDMLKVKGKGFRKEMAKKKRASWRGGGEIDQGVNSITFDDSDDE